MLRCDLLRLHSRLACPTGHSLVLSWRASTNTGSGIMGVSGDVARFDKDALSSQLPLALYLRGLIVGGKLGHRDALPSERELAERFEVSRVTVRKALRELSQEGLLEQIQGAGTFVNRAPHVEQRLSTLTSFSEDMASRGLVAGSMWLHRMVSAATPEGALALALSRGATVSRMQRLRTANGAPMALELAAIPTMFLPEPQQVEGSLYDALRSRGYPPFRALQRLTAVRLTADQAA